MQTLKNEELEQIKGGSATGLIVLGILALGVIVAGILDGFSRPLSCNE